LELARPIESIDSVAAGELFLARVKLAQEDIAAAAELLAQADQTVRRFNFIFQIPKLAALQVLLLLRQGDLAAAANLAQAHELPLSQARVHLAQGHPSSALALLEPFRQEMEARNWTDERLKVMVLQALALHADDQEEEALRLISEALALAEPGNHIRTFIDEGPPMAQLLSAAVAQGIMPDYTRRLLDEFLIPHSKLRIPNSQQSDIPYSAFRTPQSELIEPLTPRELEVLQLLAQGLSNREISMRLFLALSTVKGHNRIIFEKLQVKNRTEAAARARELGLL
jgi:LuxR family maltose regulon positive regulatory protein